MKYKLYLITLLFMFSGSTLADKNKNISPEDLPAFARFFLRTEFAEAKILSVLENTEDKCFEVITEEGSKFEFDENGQWTNIECFSSSVPTLIIPQKIITAIRKNCGPNVKILQIKRITRGRYDVELSNELGLRFDKKCEIIDVRDKELIAQQNKKIKAYK